MLSTLFLTNSSIAASSSAEYWIGSKLLEDTESSNTVSAAALPAGNDGWPGGSSPRK
jgi:hypothetical protein